MALGVIPCYLRRIHQSRVFPLPPTILVFLMVGCGAPEPTAVPARLPDIPTVVSTTPQSVPTTSATAVPGPEGDTDPTSELREDSVIEPMPSAEAPLTPSAPNAEPRLQAFPLPVGSRPHDVAPALDGGVWYTAQGSGDLGWLDPETGETRHTPLGAGSRPHGVIVGPDGAPWITDSGLNSILRVDPENLTLDVFPLPLERPAVNLNTATFDHDGTLWFTGQNGIYGRLDPRTGAMDVFDAPRVRGPYGITTNSNGNVYYASLAGTYVGRINLESGQVTVLDPPTPNQGARRVWSDSQGKIWVSQWSAGQAAVYDPFTDEWREWKLPGSEPRAYAVYVDERDMVWISDFGSNAVVRFDPRNEQFETFQLPNNPSNVRQILGRPGEVWLPESAADQLVVIRY